MKLLNLLMAGLLILTVMTGCSFTKEEVDYENSVITPTLEVPPDLISRSKDKNLSLPGSKVGLPENTGRFVDTGNLNLEQTQVSEKITDQ